MEEIKMSAPRAIAILAGMMRTASIEQIDALDMAIGRIMHKYRARMKNNRRKEAAEAITKDESEVTR